MKKLLVICFLMLAIGNINAQTVYKADDLSGNFLKKTFEDASITVLETKTDYIKTQDVFDFYVDIDDKKRFVSFSGTFLLADGTSKEKALELVNLFNTEIIVVKSYYTQSKNVISVDYYFWTEGGFTKESMLKSYKLMKTAVNLMLLKDTEKIMK